MRTILVTGSAGFIGYHLSLRLLELGHEIIGIDNINSYYDPGLKQERNRLLKFHANYHFYKIGLEDKEKLEEVFRNHKEISVVVNLGAQAGVRYSLVNPQAYVDSNLTGFVNILEACRHYGIEHLLYASSSSVYGSNTKMPFSTSDNVDHPVSLYAATKKSNELLAHTYSHLFQLPTTGLRFFTVYGPWGRPDMAYFSFTQAILNGKPIKVFNNGKMMRDFTYVDDIVEGILKLIEVKPVASPEWDRIHPDPSSSYAPYKIYNIGNNDPVELDYFINVLERRLGIEAVKDYLPMQPGDVQTTFADVSDLEKTILFKPKTNIEEGIDKFATWYEEYYQVKLNV